MNIINLETKLCIVETFNKRQYELWVRKADIWSWLSSEVQMSHTISFFFFFLQWVKKKKQETWRNPPSDDDLNLPFRTKRLLSCLAVCLCVGVCLSISGPQCWAGPGHRGFCDGVGGLCFAAPSSKSCLSVLSSWTSCNNTNRPLNRLLCCAARGWVTSHTHTCSLRDTHTLCPSDWQPHTHKFIRQKTVHTLMTAGGCASMCRCSGSHTHTRTL